MYKSTYASWMKSFHHGNHAVGGAKPPVMPPQPPVAEQPAPAPTTQAGGQMGGVGGMMPPGASTSAAGFGGMAGFFVAGFGADFFNQYNPMMSGLAQNMGFGNPFACGPGLGGGFGMGAGGGMMPKPMQPKLSSTDLKHCGFKKGIKNTIEMGGVKATDKGHGQMEVTSGGKKFTVDVNRCSKPPQIEIHANGDKKKKAMMKVPLSELKDGGTINLPGGLKLNMQANKAGNNLEKFQMVGPGGQVATMDKFGKNGEWKTGGEAMQVKGPQLSANAGFDAITKGGAAPSPGQIAQGNFNHLNPIGQFLQPRMPGLMQNPAPQMQQAHQQLGMMMNMIQLLMQMAQMMMQVGGSRFNMMGIR